MNAPARLLWLALALLLITPGLGRTEQIVCLDCHDSDMMRKELRAIPEEWRKSVHFQNGIACNDCHGGDPGDAQMAMSPERGFVGKPGYDQIPQFCGKCHIGILKNYLDSGHGRALKSSGSGPNCVTCHGSHLIQRASIDIINEERCSQCHTYERAKVIKEALFETERNIRELRGSIEALHKAGVYTEDLGKELFSTEAEFRTLFHSVDVSLIRQRTDGFLRQLDRIRGEDQNIVRELRFRKNFASYLMLVCLAAAGVLVMLFRTKG
ncbi:MAG: hypothetical protein M0024_02125 [Nitrospiraceae bacterium]|nr:hypothetical protein [Nitrospiraceae bacterium]